MPSKRQFFDKYGEERDGVNYLVCPVCTTREEFETLEAWKDHMQREHGGYTSSEVAAGQSQEPNANSDQRQNLSGESRAADRTPPPKAKRLSGKARELNDKLNRCISLVIKHLISGITDIERQELEEARTVLTEAFVGIEFDFEERLISLTGKWAVLVVLILLYTLPNIPSLKEAIAKARQKALEKATQ